MKGRGVRIISPDDLKVVARTELVYLTKHSAANAAFFGGDAVVALDGIGAA